MSMLGLQIKELREKADLLDGLEGMDNLVRMLREAADTIETLRDRLQESYGQVPELGKRENDGERESCESNYVRLFGTPERAARTVLSLDYCCEDCDKCQAFEICGLHSKFGRTVYEMTDWLRGDA